MPKRTPRQQRQNGPPNNEPAASSPQRPGPKHKHGMPFREAFPQQLAARVTQETFDKYAALRFALGSGAKEASNTQVLEAAADLLIEGLTPEQRERFKFITRQQRTRP